MKRLFLVLFLFLLTFSIDAQTLVQTDDAKKLTDNVMSQLSALKFNDGLDMLKPFSLLSAADIGTIESTLNAQLPKISPSYGKIVGTEFIAQRQVGTSLLDLKYLLKFERRALVWTFDFYNSGSGWNLLTLNYSDRLQDLFSNNIAN